MDEYAKMSHLFAGGDVFDFLEDGGFSTFVNLSIDGLIILPYLVLFGYESDMPLVLRTIVQLPILKILHTCSLILAFSCYGMQQL